MMCEILATMVELIVVGFLDVLAYKFVMTKTTFDYPMSFVFLLAATSLGLVKLIEEYAPGLLKEEIALLIGLTIGALLMFLMYRFSKTMFIHNEKRIFYRKKESFETEIKFERIIIAMIFVTVFFFQFSMLFLQ